MTELRETEFCKLINLVRDSTPSITTSGNSWLPRRGPYLLHRYLCVLERILEQRALLSHIIQLLLRVLGSDLILIKLCLLLVQLPQNKLKRRAGKDTSRNKGQRSSIACWVPGRLAIEVDVATDQTADIADTDQETDADGALLGIGAIRHVPCVHAWEDGVHSVDDISALQ